MNKNINKNMISIRHPIVTDYIIKLIKGCSYELDKTENPPNLADYSHGKIRTTK